MELYLWGLLWFALYVAFMEFRAYRRRRLFKRYPYGSPFIVSPKNKPDPPLTKAEQDLIDSPW